MAASATGTVLARLLGLANCEHMLALRSRYANAHCLANAAWAFAKLGQHNPAKLWSISSKLKAKIDNLAPLELSKISWAFATLSVKDEGLVRVLLSRAVLRLKEL